MKPLVLDASVAAKWFLPASDEPLIGEAQDLLDCSLRERIPFLVPDLFWAELANVFWKAVARNRITQEHAQASITKARELRLRVLPSFDLIEQALLIALASDRPVYDSLYIAAAIANATQFLTADERLVNATGARFPVRWLGAMTHLL